MNSSQLGWTFKKVHPLLLVLGLALASCSGKNEPEQKVAIDPLFKKIAMAHSGVGFENHIEERFEYFENFSYAYNGGGVAVGDIDNDGLPDLFFTGNEVDNRLYLNKGNLKFEDLTTTAGVNPSKGWNNGVAMVDINNDGYLDLYVCRGGWQDTVASRKNLLLLNQGNNTFAESAEAFGIADDGYSTQASFFDFDNDGDLDLYVVNRPSEFMMPIATTIEFKENPPEDNRDKLYRNDNGTYLEVGGQLGITHNFGYGLGVVTSDVNNDGFADIYVTNDFDEHDYLYLNEGGLHFRESIKTTTNHIALYSMGVDIMDINNDGLEDVFVTEMQPTDYKQAKISMPSMDIEGFNALIDKGFYYQYMHNMLQLNMGNGRFSEVAKLMGVAKTDWSWAGLASDLDNDGHKDLLVTNGFRRDIFDNDLGLRIRDFFMEHKAQYRSAQELIAAKGQEIIELYKPLKERNKLFKNTGKLGFEDVSRAWGFDAQSFSNGAAVGDLDGDGDLDLVINNLDDPAFVFENTSSKANHYLRIKPIGPSGNLLGLGAKITIWQKGLMQYQEFKMVRGYLSSQEGVVHFGLSDNDQIDSLQILWPGGKKQVLMDVKGDQVLTLDFAEARFPRKMDMPKAAQLFTTSSDDFGIDFRHSENTYNDFDLELLLPHRYSQFGPGIAKGDVNGDGLEDIYVCGAKGQSGALYLQNENGKFSLKKGPWETYGDREGLAAVFFDANGDGTPDLYVVNGGNEVALGNPTLRDNLFLNLGSSGFRDTSELLPNNAFSGSKVRPCDYDGDGDLDLFVGGRVDPQHYPSPASSVIYENKNGKFTNLTSTQAAGLKDIGLVTDALWADYDNDGDPDLILVGEWMPITIFKNTENHFERIDPVETGLVDTEGWWYSLEAADFDGDGDLDLVAGNLGLNYKYRASVASPFEVLGADFDHNGKSDIILGFNDNGVVHPLRGKQCSSQQLPGLKSKFKTYAAFSTATVEEMVGREEYQNALHLKAKTFASTYFENCGNGTFNAKVLPNLAQLSSVNDILVDDFNQDGTLDLLLAGNLYTSEVETPRNDAGYGAFLAGDGKGNFTALFPNESGAYLGGDIKELSQIKVKGKSIIVAAKNNGPLNLIELKKNKKSIL